jgi:hypothetical protein
MNPASLRGRARRALEVGRVWLGLQRALIALPVAAIALSGCRGQVSLAVGGAVLLFAAALGFSWRGGPLGRAVWPGVLAGAPPLVIPLLFRALPGGGCAGGACLLHCVGLCVAGGVIGGVMLGMWAARRSERRTEHLVAAAVVASLTGLGGCAFGGLSGAAAMVAALAAISAPVAFFAPVRRHV